MPMSWSKEARIALAAGLAVGGVGIAAEQGARALGIKVLPEVGIVRTVSLSDRSILLRFPWANPAEAKWYISNEEAAQKLLKARPYLARDIDTFPEGYQIDVLAPALNGESPKLGVLNIKKADNGIDLNYETGGPRAIVRLREQAVEVRKDDSANTAIRWLSVLFTENGTPIGDTAQMRLGDEKRNLLYYDEFGQPRRK